MIPFKYLTKIIVQTTAIEDEESVHMQTYTFHDIRYFVPYTTIALNLCVMRSPET